MSGIIASFVLISTMADPSAREQLEKMVSSRRAFATSNVRWSIASPLAAKGYRRGQSDGVNWTFAYEADPDGVVQPLQLGEPFSCSANRFLCYGGMLWNLRDDNAGGMLFDWGPQRDRGLTPVAFDPRMLGIMPEYDPVELDEFITSLGVLPDSAFSQQKGDHGIIVVSANFGGSVVKWWLDTERGSNPIRVQRRDHGGTIWGDSRIDLALYDGHVWYPRKIDLVENRSSGPVPVNIQIESAEFDRPSHPPMLTPVNIGAVPLNYFARQGPGTKDRFVFWSGTGTELYGTKEFLRRRKLGQFAHLDGSEWDERWRTCESNNLGRWPAWYAQSNYGIDKPADIDAWETYVRRFCLIRKLDDRQKASAKSILDDCRKTATPIVTKAKTEKDAAKRDAILAGVADIFTKSLVPRLESQLTIPQSQPTTKPAATVKLP